MNYRRNKKQRPWGVLVLVVLVLLFGMFGFRIFGGTATSVAGPIWNFREGLAHDLNLFFATFQSKVALERQNGELRQALREAELALIDRNTLKAENETLRDLLEYTSNTQRILARVVVRPPETLYDTLVIDRGTRNGITEGTRAFVGENVLLGTVEEANRSTSRVHFFSSSGTVIDVVFAGEDGVVSARGQGNGNFIVEVPQNVSVAVGDVVILAGTSYSVGIVGAVVRDPGDEFQTVRFSLPLPLTHIDFVTIGR